MFRITENQPVVIRHDGVEVGESTGKDLLAWFHRRVSYSMDHALRFEGYSVHPVVFDVFEGRDEKHVVATKVTQRAADREMNKRAEAVATVGWKRRELGAATFN